MATRVQQLPKIKILTPVSQHNTSHMSEIKMGILGFVFGNIFPTWLVGLLGAFVNGALGAAGAILVTYCVRKYNAQKNNKKTNQPPTRP